jgi:hypothetical protein
MLLTKDLGTLMEAGFALLDGTTVFLVAMLVRRLGGNRDAARFASLFYLGSYASFAALVYGFSAQIFGQWFSVPLALLLMTPDRPPSLRRWSLALLVLLFGVYSHIGVAILGISWVGCILLLSLRRPTAAVWRAIVIFAACVLGAAFFMYLDIAAMTFSHTSSVLQSQGDGGGFLPGATAGLLKGVRLAYTDVGAALIPFGLLLLALARPRLERLVVPLGMVLTVLFYLAVDLALRLQVRYFYFGLPFALALIAYLLGSLALRGRPGRATAYALVAAVAFQGVAIWFSTAFFDGQISMTPLTH